MALNIHFKNILIISVLKKKRVVLIWLQIQQGLEIKKIEKNAGLWMP